MRPQLHLSTVEETLAKAICQALQKAKVCSKEGNKTSIMPIKIATQ